MRTPTCASSRLRGETLNVVARLLRQPRRLHGTPSPQGENINMPRKRKTSPAEDFVELVALMPWWAGVVLAVVGYLVLHSFASSPPSPVKSASLDRSLIWGAWARAFAMVGQFVVPIICAVGALLSFLKRRKRQALHQGVRQSTSPDALEHMSWQEFELLVGEGFASAATRSPSPVAAVPTVVLIW
jgi:hypothetical protein